MSHKITDELDDDHPLWLVNEQIKGLLEGEGASEDHEDVLAFLRNTGLPEGTVTRMHRALVCAEQRFAVRTGLVSVLREIIGQENPNQWGYDAARVALDDDWRARARAAYARATGQER
jgi:hypothetical protein